MKRMESPDWLPGITAATSTASSTGVTPAALPVNGNKSILTSTAARDEVDAQASYNITDNYKVFAEASNLLECALRELFPDRRHRYEISDRLDIERAQGFDRRNGHLVTPVGYGSFSWAGDRTITVSSLFGSLGYDVFKHVPMLNVQDLQTI